MGLLATRDLAVMLLLVMLVVVDILVLQSTQRRRASHDQRSPDSGSPGHHDANPGPMRRRR